jgi:hypothetical protein
MSAVGQQRTLQTALPYVRLSPRSRRKRCEIGHAGWDVCCRGQSERAGPPLRTSAFSHKETFDGVGGVYPFGLSLLGNCCRDQCEIAFALVAEAMKNQTTHPESDETSADTRTVSGESGTNRDQLSNQSEFADYIDAKRKATSQDPQRPTWWSAHLRSFFR